MTDDSESEQIYLSPPHMGESEIDYVREAFETNWIAPAGPHIPAFEEELCEIVEADHAVALASGTAALHLALIEAGVEAGDEVLCSTLTFAASANAVVYEDAEPVFVDSERESWNMDPQLLREALEERASRGERPAAVVVTHLYGQPADIDPIAEACRTYDVPLIEDVAEALGARYKGRHPGTDGLAGIFSFNGNKIITTSGGGMLVSDDEEVVEHARKLSTQAKDDAPHYQHSEIGYNYRLSNVLAGIGRGQLEVLEERVDRRREIFEYYREGLGDLPGVEFQSEPEWAHHTRWLTTLTIDPEAFGATRSDVRRALDDRNAEARPVWKPLHLQPVFEDCDTIGGRVAEEIFEYGLCLPSGTAMTDEQLRRVVEAFRGCRDVSDD
jgi:pyridoxal phosphate-dependent aminotransferase EpsN